MVWGALSPQSLAEFHFSLFRSNEAHISPHQILSHKASYSEHTSRQVFQMLWDKYFSGITVILFSRPLVWTICLRFLAFPPTLVLAHRNYSKTFGIKIFHSAEWVSTFNSRFTSEDSCLFFSFEHHLENNLI